VPGRPGPELFMTVIDLLNFLGGTPLHVMLFVAVYFLWRRQVALETKLEKCLRDRGQRRKSRRVDFRTKQPL